MKWIGILLISSVPAILGWLKYRELHRRLNTLTELIAFVQEIHRQLRFKAEPLWKILCDLSASGQSFAQGACGPENAVETVSQCLQELEVDSDISDCVIHSFKELQTCDIGSASEILLLCCDSLSAYKSRQEEAVREKSGM